MIIIRVCAGLGNQMFQYALYERLKTFNKNVLVDVTSYEKSPIHNNYELENIFSICPQKASFDQIKKVKRPVRELSILKRLHRKIMLTCGLPYTHYIEKQFYKYDPRVLNLPGLSGGGGYYLDGYWQTYKYFDDIKPIILKKFSFPELDPQNPYLKMIKNSESVSVHVRRTDFLNNSLHRNICTLQYYKQAFQLMKKTINNPSFFIFSDDIPWCRDNLGKEENCEYIMGNTGANSYRDMQLMSLCRHNIIANSSFSWWGAYLNQNPDKVVVAPSRMINGDYDFNDAFPPDWELIQV